VAGSFVFLVFGRRMLIAAASRLFFRCEGEQQAERAPQEDRGDPAERAVLHFKILEKAAGARKPASLRTR
jgi:hypothetical protein